jgi:hypothetical protein
VLLKRGHFFDGGIVAAHLCDLVGGQVPLHNGVVGVGYQQG